MKTIQLIVTAAFAVALAACSGDKASEQAPGSEAPSPVDTGTVEPMRSPVAANDRSIPEGLRGRWGLVAADCTSSRGDAKGLLTVSEDQLKFYESVAKLDQVKAADTDRITGTFAFTGEGQSWSLDVTLASPDGGKTLVRKDTGPDAAPAPLTYTRCP